MLLLVVAMLVLAVGCEEQAGTTTLQLRFMTGRSGSTQTRDPVSPGGQGLAITDYTVTGQGPNGKTFSVATSSAQVEISGLVIGTWNIEVQGLNQQGSKLAEGSVSHHLTTKDNQVEVLLDDFDGSGTVRIGFSWGDNEFTNIALDLKLTAQGESQQTVPPDKKSIDESTATATYESVLATGSYELVYNLYSNSHNIGGGVVAIRILDGMIAERDITIMIDKVTPEATGLSISSRVVEPVLGIIENIGESILPNTPVIASFRHTEGGGELPLMIDWYLDGRHIGEGESVEFATYTGNHQLDVIAQTSGFGSVGSESHPFQASVEPLGGVPVTIHSISNGDTDTYDNPYWLQDIRDTAFLRDGNLLVASAQGLQICSVSKDTLVVEQSYTSSSYPSFPTSDITDIEVDTFNDIVVTTARNTGILVFYQYRPSTNSLELITTVSGSSDEGKWGDVGISNAILDTAIGQVYVMKSGSRRLYHAPYGDDGVGTFRYVSLFSSDGHELNEHSSISMDSLQRRIAVACTAPGTFFVFKPTLQMDGETIIMHDHGYHIKEDPSIDGPLALHFSEGTLLGLMSDGVHLFKASDTTARWNNLGLQSGTRGEAHAMVLDPLKCNGWAVQGETDLAVSHMTFQQGYPSYSPQTMETDVQSPMQLSCSPKGDLLCLTGTQKLRLLRIAD